MVKWEETSTRSKKMIRSFNSSNNLLSENTLIIPKYPVNREIKSIEQAQMFWEEFRDFWGKRQKSTGYPSYKQNYDMSAWALIVQDEKNQVPMWDNEQLDSILTLRRLECVSYFLMDFISKNKVEAENPKELRVSLSTSSDGDSRKIEIHLESLVKDKYGQSVYADTSNALTRMFESNSSPFSCLRLALTEEIKKQGYGYCSVDLSSIKSIQDSIAQLIDDSLFLDLKKQRDLQRDIKRIDSPELTKSSPFPSINRF